MTKEQMNTELSEIRTYYMMKRTLDESVTEFEEMFQLLDKYIKIIKKAPIKLKGYFVERYENGSNASQMAEKWEVSNSYVANLKREFFKFVFENLNKEDN